MPAKKGGRSASPQKGATGGKGRGGEKAINKAGKDNAASGKGSTTPPRNADHLKEHQFQKGDRK